MTGTISSDPSLKPGKSLEPQTTPLRGSDLFASLPYEAFRVHKLCKHSDVYVLKLHEEQPPFCGLCLIREGFESEMPTKFHMYKTLAENGNPETAPKFLAHLVLAMGLVPPRDDESLAEWRKRRNSLAREQYRRRSPVGNRPYLTHLRVERFSAPSKLFPVASALWKLMGYQPPLGRALVPAVGGKNEIEISKTLGISYYDTHLRIAKGIRTVMGFMEDGERR